MASKKIVAALADQMETAMATTTNNALTVVMTLIKASTSMGAWQYPSTLMTV